MYVHTWVAVNGDTHEYRRIVSDTVKAQLGLLHVACVGGFVSLMRWHVLVGIVAHVIHHLSAKGVRHMSLPGHYRSLWVRVSCRLAKCLI